MPGPNPSYAFRGRTSEIAILKPGASFGAAPTVTVGDGTIKVKSVKSVAADTVKIRLNVPLDAAPPSIAGGDQPLSLPSALSFFSSDRPPTSVPFMNTIGNVGKPAHSLMARRSFHCEK